MTKLRKVFWNLREVGTSYVTNEGIEIETYTVFYTVLFVLGLPVLIGRFEGYGTYEQSTTGFKTLRYVGYGSMLLGYILLYIKSFKFILIRD